MNQIKSHSRRGVSVIPPTKPLRGSLDDLAGYTAAERVMFGEKWHCSGCTASLSLARSGWYCRIEQKENLSLAADRALSPQGLAIAGVKCERR